MNQFYEQELPDISKDIDTSRDGFTGEKAKLNKSNGVEKRRYHKKDP